MQISMLQYRQIPNMGIKPKGGLILHESKRHPL